MKAKRDNDLIMIHAGNKKHYFTSLTRAGRFLGLQASSISWAIANRNELKNNAGETVTIEIVDGSEIPYKLINN